MNDLYIMHYGVGHDKGGHSGRYPWGSGKNPYGGVDPTTTKKDLFKLNKRSMRDVASDLIVKSKYGDLPNVSEVDIAKSKYRTMAFLRGAESTAILELGSLAGAVTGAFNPIAGAAVTGAAAAGAVAKAFIGKYNDHKLVSPDMAKKIREDKLMRRAVKRANVVVIDPDIIKAKS